MVKFLSVACCVTIVSLLLVCLTRSSYYLVLTVELLGVLCFGVQGAFPSLLFQLCEITYIHGTTLNACMCVMHHSVNNLQEKLESLHACGCRQLFNSLYLMKKKQGGPQGESFEGFAPQLAFTHLCMALAFFHLFFGLSFSSALESTLCSFFDLLPLLLFSSLSFLHTAPTQRSELVMRAANSLL